MSPMLVHDMGTLKQHLDVKLYDHQTQHAHIMHICIYTHTHIHIHIHIYIYAYSFQKTFLDLTNTTMIRPDNHTQTLVNDHISAFVARFCLLFVCAAECLGHPESLVDPAVAGGGYRRRKNHGKDTESGIRAAGDLF